MTPLCPGLFRRLEERFGSVIIANEGEGLIPYPKKGSRAALSPRVVHPGGTISRLLFPMQ